MARVICWVFLTLVMRRRMSLRLGIGSGGARPLLAVLRLAPLLRARLFRAVPFPRAPLEHAAELVEGGRELVLRVVLELPGLADRLEQLAVARAHEFEQLALVTAEVRHRVFPHPGVASLLRRGGVDGDDLLLHRHGRVLG